MYHKQIGTTNTLYQILGHFGISTIFFTYIYTQILYLDTDFISGCIEKLYNEKVEMIYSLKQREYLLHCHCRGDLCRLMVIGAYGCKIGWGVLIYG